MLCNVWIQGSVIREGVIPVHLPTSRICPFPRPALWLPLLDVIRALHPVLGGMVCCCHCQLGSASWWIWCLLAIRCVDGMMWLAPSAGILLGDSSWKPLSGWEYPACISPTNMASAPCCSRLCRELSPYFMLRLSVPELWNQLQSIVS